MNLPEILVIVVFHWFADFIMQDGEWAINKSKNHIALLKHTGMYSILWSILGFLITSPLVPIFDGSYMLELAIIFPLVTFICHTVTDYFTSRAMGKMYREGNFGTRIPRGLDFFTTLGLDQVLHYVQLFGTYYILMHF